MVEVVDRHQIILETRVNNPCATLQEIGDKVGVTRERVRQVLKKARLPTMHWRQTYLCLQCGTEMTKPQKFCSPECQHAYNYITVYCAWCNKPKEVLTSHFMYRIAHGFDSPDKNFFCSKRCQGLWLAYTHGFGVYPEHAIKGSIYREPAQELCQKGYGPSQIAEILGCTASYVSMLTREIRGKGIRGPAVNKIDRELVKRLVIQGYNKARIARITQTNRSTVWRICEELGLEPLRNYRRIYDYEAIRTMDLQGSKQRFIAQNLNMPVKSVTRILERQRHGRKYD